MGSAGRTSACNSKNAGCAIKTNISADVYYLWKKNLSINFLLRKILKMQI